MTALDDLVDRYMDELAALDPCQAAIMGIAGQDSRLTDYGPDGLAARADLARATLARLNAVAPAAPPASAPAATGGTRPGAQNGATPTPTPTPTAGAAPSTVPGTAADADRIAAAVLRERLETDLALHDAHVHDTALNTLEGPLQRLRIAIELLDRGDDTDWDAVRGRLRALPGALRDLRTGLLRACQNGRIVARRQIARNVQSCLETPGCLAEITARHGGGPLRGELDDAVAAASRALAEFAEFLSGELAPRAPERDALGADRYRLGVRDLLGTTLDLEETYAWGWEELARIETEMDEAGERILPGEPLPAVRAALDNDPAYRIHGADAFRAWIQELADRAIGDLDGVHFDIPAPLRRIECRIPPVESGIYYLAPSEDLSRPGRVWWTVKDRDQDIVTWTVPGIMFHEGVPGHHLQLGVTILNTGLNRFQRLSSELYPGYCEGWGLYAERLMGELGYYHDPAHLLGMLAGGQQFRAARVILDIGMHLELPIPAGTGFHEGERWTPQLALEFLRAHAGPQPEAAITFEVDRYLGLPAQAIAYKVGEKVWLEAREAARARAGTAFDLKEFHRRALDLGPMGLDRMRAELTRA
ncbi:DUF885 domain-containing protein [Actinomadura graeca]|uniref:DUF885 domain-containing protein n=1 Tax=Actinomadura graeca TaxID=2750812 RepID=A0ABX8QMU9_9ACTN|nr:DUF885 domain-containing protein [Actinomadura graeca]QXJ19815.1 DUF885 domain-containing protein [Actinomadura graeca]